MQFAKWNKLQQNLNMKSLKETIAVLSSLVEMLLQQRVAPSRQAQESLDEIRCELQVQGSQQKPDQNFWHSLINKEFYEIKNKLLLRSKTASIESMTIVVKFTICDKLTSLVQVAEIWRIAVGVQQKSAMGLQIIAHEMVHLYKKIVEHLGSQFIFSELIRSREINKKYIIDYKIQMFQGCGEQDSYLAETGTMWNVRSRISQERYLKVDCYWRQNLQLSIYKNGQNGQQIRKGKNKSSETCGDSCQLNLSNQANQRRFRSFEQPQQAYEIYDSQLQMTILSSDSDQMNGSRRVISELTCEVDEFQLLIEEDNKDDMFIIENEQMLREWSKMLPTIFN